MTSSIDNNIDGLIKRVRQRPAVSDIVFMADRYTATVSNTGVKQSQVFIGDTVGTGLRGYLYEAKLVIRVYAPRDTSASALLRISSLLFDAFDACNTDGAITNLSLGEVAYDGTARTVYRDLRVDLSWILTGEDAS